MKAAARKGMQIKSLGAPDETRKFRKGKLELATVGMVTFGRATFKPGWRWSKDVKPIAKTESCLAPHTQYIVSGKLKIVMDNGQSKVLEPGDISYVPPGHDAWVVGNKSVVAIDVTGMKQYAKGRSR
jgi:hypothetical protein